MSTFWFGSILALILVIFIHPLHTNSTNECSLERVFNEEFTSKHWLQSINVEIYSFNGYMSTYGNFHPNNLLLESGTEWYCSKQVKTMKGNNWCEYDWIIFKIKDEENIYLPSKVAILNHNAEAAVKYMSVYIGDANKNIWYKFEENPFKFSMQKDYKQSREFNYDAISWDYNNIKKENLKYIRVELLDNYMGDGHRFIDSCNFLFYHLSFYGYKL